MGSRDRTNEPLGKSGIILSCWSKGWQFVIVEAPQSSATQDPFIVLSHHP